MTLVVLVAAVAENGVIGRDGGLPWHLDGELAHFKATTTGHTLVMGRKTFESIGRPLPGRDTVVVTRDPLWHAEGVRVAHDLPSAVALVERGDAMVVGGGEVYTQALPLADRMVLTEVHASPDGDVFFPDWDREQWREVQRTRRDDFDLVWWERVT